MMSQKCYNICKLEISRIISNNIAKTFVTILLQIINKKYWPIMRSLIEPQ